MPALHFHIRDSLPNRQDAGSNEPAPITSSKLAGPCSQATDLGLQTVRSAIPGMGGTLGTEYRHRNLPVARAGHERVMDTQYKKIARTGRGRPKLLPEALVTNEEQQLTQCGERTLNTGDAVQLIAETKGARGRRAPEQIDTQTPPAVAHYHMDGVIAADYRYIRYPELSYVESIGIIGGGWFRMDCKHAGISLL